MNPENILQIVIIATGIMVLMATVNSLAHRKMTESFCLAWGLIAVILVVAGIILRPTQWSSYMSPMGLLLVILIGFCVIYVAYFMSIKVSELSRRNQELAIQVSLLKQENQVLDDKLERLAEILEKGEKCEEDEKDPVCD